MAATATGVRLTELHYNQQTALRAATLRDVARLFPALDLTSFESVDRSWPALEAALRALITRQYGVSAGLSVNYYGMLRAAEGVAGAATPLVASPLVAEQVEVPLRVTGPYTAKRLIAVQDRQASAKTLARLSGSVSRLVANGGRGTLDRSVRADRRALGWARVTSGSPCAFCRLLRSRGAVFKSAASSKFEAHDHCVVGSTIVSGPSVEAAYRRWYEGELVIIGTAEGDELAITANHPVLTDRGWVDAGLLGEGDYLVHRTGAKRLSTGVPNEDHVPAPIEDAWRSYGVDGFRPVPVAAQDFHGDGVGTQGDVHVVAPHGRFPAVFDASLGKLGAQQFRSLAGASSVAGSFSCPGDFLDVLVGAGGASDGCVCGGDLGGFPFRAERRLVEDGRFLGGPSLGAALGEPAFHDVAGYTEVPGDLLLGTAAGVDLGDALWGGELVGVGSAELRSRFDPPPLEAETERLRVHADLGSRLLERLAGQVQLRRLRDLRRVGYSGHVFNLRTSEGWFDASSLVVSNCSCTSEPVWSNDQPLPPGSSEDAELYRRVTAGLRGRDAIAAFRAAVTDGA